MPDKRQFDDLIDQLPLSEVEADTRYVEFLLAREEPPVDAELLASIDGARATPSPGIPHEEILREFGLLDDPRTIRAPSAKASREIIRVGTVGPHGPKAARSGHRHANPSE